MKPTSHLVHKLVKSLHCENFFASVGPFLPYAYRFIPLHYNYPTSEIRNIRRDNVNFTINMSDYMQWHIYANLPESSWQWSEYLTQDEAVVFDVGANVGVFALKLAQTSKQKGKNITIHAFEPNPGICQSLENNLALNPDLFDSICIESICLSSESGTIPFHVDEANTGGGSMLNKESSNTHEILVKAITLDEFVTKNDIQRLDFLKIDVEGSEPYVLQGALETLRRFKPYIYIEMTNPWFKKIGSSNQRIVDLLTNLGYTCKEVLDTGQLKAQTLTQKTIDGDIQFNMIASPTEVNR